MVWMLTPLGNQTEEWTQQAEINSTAGPPDHGPPDHGPQEPNSVFTISHGDVEKLQELFNSFDAQYQAFQKLHVPLPDNDQKGKKEPASF